MGGQNYSDVENQAFLGVLNERLRTLYPGETELQKNRCRDNFKKKLGEKLGSSSAERQHIILKLREKLPNRSAKSLVDKLRNALKTSLQWDGNALVFGTTGAAVAAVAPKAAAVPAVAPKAGPNILDLIARLNGGNGAASSSAPSRGAVASPSAPSDAAAASSSAPPKTATTAPSGPPRGRRADTPSPPDAPADPAFVLPPPTPEQRRAINTLLERHRNLQLIAAPGAGKTTFALHLAEEAKKTHLRVLLLVFNRKLRDETVAKKDQLDLPADSVLEVQTFHGFFVKFYHHECRNDSGLLKHVLGKDKNWSPLPDSGNVRARFQTERYRPFDVLVLDESQDVNRLLFECLGRFWLEDLPDMLAGEEPPRLAIVSDPRQSVYSFNEADGRFGSRAPEVFATFNNRLWEKKRLSISWRIGAATAQFVNEGLLNGDFGEVIVAADGASASETGSSPGVEVGAASSSSSASASSSSSARMRSVVPPNGPPSSRPRYVVCNMFPPAPGVVQQSTDPYAPLAEVERYFALGFQPRDIFVLAYSLKSDKSPGRVLENRLLQKNDTYRKRYGFSLDGLIHRQISDGTKQLDLFDLEDCLVFSSWHQVKGLERPVVLGFDSSYFKMYKREDRLLDWSVCPNIVYVAATRSKRHLSLIQQYNQEPFPFFRDLGKLRQLCEVVDDAQASFAQWVRKWRRAGRGPG